MRKRTVIMIEYFDSHRPHAMLEAINAMLAGQRVEIVGPCAPDSHPAYHVTVKTYAADDRSGDCAAQGVAAR